MVVTGAPTAISRICDTIKTMVLNNMLVITIGVGAVTALNVRTQVNNIVGSLMLGVGQAVIPIAGMFYGEEDRTALRDTLKSTMRIGIGSSLIAAVLLCIFPKLFPYLLGITEGDIMTMSVQAIVLFAVSMPFFAVNTILKNFYQCTEKPGIATVICFLQSLVYTTLAAVLLIRPFGSMGVWVAFVVGEILTLLTILIWLACKQKKLPTSLNDYMMLPETLGGNPHNRLELSIGNDMDEVMKIATGIYKFVNGRSIDDHVATQLSLCIEEMAGNIVKHAFKPGEVRWFDILVVDKADSLLIQLRDDGSMFDPVAFYKDQDETKLDQNIGIHLIQSIAHRFEYRRSIGLNNLIIVLKK